MRGFFITFEGAEGAGKSTQCQKLAEHFTQIGRDVVLTKEPGAGAICASIREIILNPENTGLTPRAEAFLYASDRAQHVSQTVLPALKAGKVVICDRYIDSNIAYQAYGRGMSVDFIYEINQLATDGLEPELTFLIEIDPKAGLNRAAARGKMDRMEQENIDFHNRVTAGFNEIAKENPKRVQKIDGNRPIEEIAAEIWEIVLKKIAD